MLKKIRCGLAIAMSLSILVSQIPMPAAAQATVEQVRFSGSFPMTIFFDCVGEPISVVVTFKGHMRITNTPSGGQNADMHTIFVGKGQGDITGITFRGPSSEHETLHVNGNNGNFVDTHTLNFTGVRQGSADNIIVKILFHITVNANGDATAEMDRFEVECRG